MAQSHPLIAWSSNGSPGSTTAMLAASSVAGGCWVNASELKVSVHDIGFRQSVVAVERLRTYRGRPVAVPQHIIRWRRTLDHLAIAVAVDEHAIVQRIDELIRRNQSWCERAGDFGITMLATPGCPSDEGSWPTEMLHLNSLDHAKIIRHRTVGQPLVITDIQHPPAKSWPRDIKVRCRLHYYLADRIATQIDPAAVGLLVDADGSVTETSIANLAICREGVIISPPPQQVLPGITQQLVEQVADELDIPWAYASLFPADVRQAEEVWLMGTDGGLWFASRVDGAPIGNAQPGSVYRRAITQFDAALR